jgi:hypothetical protein
MFRSRTPSPARSLRQPVPSTPRRSTKRDSRNRDRGYSLPRGKSPPRRRSEVTLLMCVFHTSSHNWKTAPVKYNPNRTNDRELWEEIRNCYRYDLHHPWSHWLSLRHVTAIVPVSFSPSGVPQRVDPKDFPESRLFRHAYHHPEQIKTDHSWVDWFTDFDSNDKATNGLEFREGLWADKLALLAIGCTVAIVVVSIVWCVKGGVLQTVFTVMSFVLTQIAAIIAFVALYYQIVSNDTGGSN